ncbi:MBL fold metallo-hydrolase [Paenibacillus sp. GSMTC-2017]|uniref:MBL fold metallo-hydrolase n=1 Tax=Paenibacillus sp. GSMTC-2017 TaxID=2794350 RepID=UPI0018D6733E|nr:MBL fold metallo-hydrolase [Paenibacillus sp. GSMTC-2017]MBH5319116.1 MBL fold metallo-hydrolase [Paenibacillus sp. GSMTC-2017]
MVKATVICENTVFSNLGAIAEHGWAVHLETGHGNFLFDTGQGKALVNNMNVFNKKWSDISGIMLSHHHCDHTGGLLSALEEINQSHVPVYAHPHLFKKGYLVRKDYRYIGIPHSKETLEDAGAHFVYNRDFVEIAPNIYLTGEVPRTSDYEIGDTDIVVETKDGYAIDPVEDDQSVIIRTENGLFIILGCSHAGMINILNYAKAMTGESRIHTVIGGTHLWTVSEEQKSKTIEALVEMDIERIGVSHCTGFEVSSRMALALGNRFFHCNVGMVVEV